MATRIVLILATAGLAVAQQAVCPVCRITTVKGTATQPLGPTQHPQACATRPGANGYPIPDPQCTPGAFNPTVPPAVFGDKRFSTKCVRDCLTTSVQKHTTYTAYHVNQNASCELDHLVPLEIGGADSLDNIWPQCGQAPNGKNYKDLKDEVENYLAIEVLLGKMTVDDARKGIASDWTNYLAAALSFCSAQSCDIGKYRK